MDDKSSVFLKKKKKKSFSKSRIFWVYKHGLAVAAINKYIYINIVLLTTNLNVLLLTLLILNTITQNLIFATTRF